VIGGARYPLRRLDGWLRRVGSAAEGRSAFGPHAIGTERFTTVTSGASWCRSQVDPGKQAWVANPDKDEVQGGCHRVPYETTHLR